MALTLLLIALEYRLGADGYFHQQTSHFLGPIAPFLGMAMWGLWVADARLAVVRFLNWKPFVYFGHLSYPMYLTHLTFISYCQHNLTPQIARLVDGPRAQYLVAFVLAFIMTSLAGAFIWHAIEVPASRLKRRFPLDPSRVRRTAMPAGATPQPG